MQINFRKLIIESASQNVLLKFYGKTFSLTNTHSDNDSL